MWFLSKLPFWGQLLHVRESPHFAANFRSNVTLKPLQVVLINKLDAAGVESARRAGVVWFEDNSFVGRRSGRPATV